MQTGDIISFGNYDWRVLVIQDNTALIITENIIEQRSYHNVYKDVTWADCELRKYLNNEFYDRFDKTHKSKILTVTNKNPDNPWYGTKGGEYTEDNIFLLTIEDAVCRYFGDSGALLQNPGKQKYKYWFNKKDENNIKRMSKYEGENWGSWW